ncbi:hypothetical protein YSY43_34140 [Paenibacillus sp. YSY-4.3]
MSYICPLCNGLAPLTAACPDCGSTLDHAGRKQDYAGPYSPYGSADQYNSVISSRQPEGCEHVVQCPRCHEAYIYHVNAWPAP